MTRPASSDFCVSTSGDSPATVTVSCSVAIFIVKLSTADWPTSSGKFSCTTRVEPRELELNAVNRPIGCAGIRKTPVVDVTVRPDRAGIDVGGGDGHAGQRGAAFIDHRSPDFRQSGLSERRSGRQSTQCRSPTSRDRHQAWTCMSASFTSAVAPPLSAVCPVTPGRGFTTPRRELIPCASTLATVKAVEDGRPFFSDQIHR